MLKDLSIAKRYAKALFSVAEENKRTQVFLSDLKRIKTVLDENPELFKFLNNPMVAKEDKTDVVEKLFRVRISNHCVNLLKLLSEKNRLKILNGLIFAYEEQLNEFLNIAPVTVKSAVEVDSRTRQRLKKVLESKLNKTVEVDYKLAPELIAGMVIDISDTIIDGSVKSKFNDIGKKLYKY